MPASLAALVYGPNGELQMLVMPDFDSQLDDPSYNQPGTTQVRIALSEMEGTAFSATDHQALGDKYRPVKLAAPYQAYLSAQAATQNVSTDVGGDTGSAV